MARIRNRVEELAMPRTRFVKSPDQIRRLQEIYAAPAFLEARSLGLTFLTDPDVVAELLPPPLQPAAEPRVSVGAGWIGRSNCVGPFGHAAINIACTYGGEEGLYCLTMPMSTDTAVIFGRELYAEPKKLADIRLDVQGRTARATVARHGIAYIELSAVLDGDGALEPVDRATRSSHYYFKYLPAADGRGLAGDVELVRVTHRGTVFRMARGAGTITFRESAHDPVIDLPVVSVTAASLTEAETYTTAQVVERIPAERFLPWAYGKFDDMTVWAGAAALQPA